MCSSRFVEFGLKLNLCQLDQSSHVRARPTRSSGEPAEHLVYRTRDPDDMPAVKLHQGLVAAFIGG